MALLLYILCIYTFRYTISLSVMFYSMISMRLQVLCTFCTHTFGNKISPHSSVMFCSMISTILQVLRTLCTPLYTYFGSMILQVKYTIHTCTFGYTTSPSVMFCSVVNMISAVRKASDRLTLLLALSSSVLSIHCTECVINGSCIRHIWNIFLFW